MGASAAQSVFGRATPVEKSRRQFFDHAIGGHRTRVVVTVHPSYLLRLPDEESKAAAYANFVEDLRIAHVALGRVTDAEASDNAACRLAPSHRRRHALCRAAA